MKGIPKLVGCGIALSSFTLIFGTLTAPHISIGQENTNFMPYTNSDLGFIMDVPYDWILDDEPPADFNYVVIYPEPTSSVPISELDALVDIRVNPTNQTLDEMADEMDTLARNFSNTAVRVTEINTNDYYLGGHPAIRSVAVGNLHFGSQNATEKKAVSYDTIIDGKHYALSEEAKVDLYPEFEPIFQRMVESFRAIELQ